MASPEFRFERSSSELTLKPTEDVVKLTCLSKLQLSAWKAKSSNVVREEAKARVLEQAHASVDPDADSWLVDVAAEVDSQDWPQESHPPHVTGGGLGVLQQGGCYLPVVTVDPGCDQNCLPPNLGYRTDCGGRLAERQIIFWPVTDSVNSGAQSYLGAMNGTGVSQVATPSPGPETSPPRNHVDPIEPTKHNGPYIRRPPNAFMIFMRENREHVTATFKPKHSVEAHSILGHMWKSMTSEQQHRYYLLAAEERRKHEERHPNWSSKDNYGRKVKSKRTKVKAG
ncbi:uncharacterized protein ACB058_021639 [Synchiropus picturatus]